MDSQTLSLSDPLDLTRFERKVAALGVLHLLNTLRGRGIKINRADETAIRELCEDIEESVTHVPDEDLLETLIKMIRKLP